MKRTILILTIIALQLPRLFAGNAPDTLTSQKDYFNQAKAELEQMLSGAKPLDYERAVFVTENAYLENAISYESYQGIVSFHATNIQRLAEANRKPQDFKPSLLETEAQQRENYDKLLYNWAIYTYFTDTTAIMHRNDGKNTIYVHRPFEYPTSDPMATLDWSHSQTINLLNNKAANCNAQVALYKILSDRLNTGAKIGTAPSHAYITHTDTRGTTYNVELPTRTFPGAGAIMTVTYSPVDAVRSGISMRSLTPSQSVALCLVYLAKGYEHRFGKADKGFTMNCSETALRYDSLCLNALLLKAEILEAKVTAKHKMPTQLQTDKDFIAYQKTVGMLYKKGYREMPLDMKNLIVSHLKQDTANFLQQNRTPRGFQSINPQDDRYATLSWGIYDEVHEPKRFEQYGRAIFDTKTMKISKLVTADSLYNNYPFDPVIAAWQVDPLFAKYPAISPYVAFADNPILYIDPDGREVVATSVASRQMILNTLTKEDRAFVQFNDNGQLNLDLINTANSSSGNFQALLQLANDKTIFEVNVDNKFDYKNENGDISTREMGDITQDALDDIGAFSPKTGEEGFMGVTQTPGEAPQKYNSIDDKVRITVNSGLSAEGQAEIFSHEGYGHGYLYSKGQNHKHQVKNIEGILKETNQQLSDQIIKSMDETVENNNCE